MIDDLITFIGRFHPLWVNLPIVFMIVVMLNVDVVLPKKPTLPESVSFYKKLKFDFILDKPS